MTDMFCLLLQFPMGGPENTMGPMGPADMPPVMNGELYKKHGSYWSHGYEQ